MNGGTRLSDGSPSGRVDGGWSGLGVREGIGDEGYKLPPLDLELLRSCTPNSH